MRRLTFLSLILLTCSITISSFSSCCTYVFDSDNKLILCCSIAQQIISHIQAWGDGVQVLAWPGTGLSVWTLSCVGLHRSLKLLNDSICVPPGSSRHLLVVPRFQRDTYGRRTFAVPGPTTWNLFQNNLREPNMQIAVFVVHWRRVFLIRTTHIEHIRGAFCDDALYKLTFTFTFTFTFTLSEEAWWIMDCIQSSITTPSLATVS